MTVPPAKVDGREAGSAGGVLRQVHAGGPMTYRRETIAAHRRRR
jgi:hypothetical protein